MNTPSRRTLERPELVLPGGLAILAVGWLIFQAGLLRWLGAERMTDYFGPALLLGPDASPYGAVSVGAVVWLLGLALSLLGVYRLAHSLDLAAARNHPQEVVPSAGCS
jgi:hypothetical protein